MRTRVIEDGPDPGVSGPVVTEPVSRPPRSNGTAFTVSGAIALLVALALLAGGAAVLFAFGNRDSDGYLTTGAHRIATPANALVSERLDIGTDWPFGGDAATGRIEARSSAPVFVGIGPSADVERYMSGIAHSQITDVNTDPFRVTSRLVPGAAQAGAPGAQTFWRVQASGPGAQTVTWPVQAGQWSVVMMNADGSPGVDVQARFGARVPLVRWVGIGLLVAGAIALIGGGLLMRRGYQRRTA